MSVSTDVLQIGPKLVDVLVPGAAALIACLCRDLLSTTQSVTTFLYFEDACNQMHPIQISANS